MLKRTSGAFAAVVVALVLAVMCASSSQAATATTTISGTPGDKHIYNAKTYNAAPATVRSSGELTSARYAFDGSSKLVTVTLRTPLPSSVPSGYRVKVFFSVNNNGAPVPQPGRDGAQRSTLVQYVAGAVVVTGSSAQLQGPVCRAGRGSSVRVSSYSTTSDYITVTAPLKCLGGVAKVYGSAGVKTVKGAEVLTIDRIPTRALER